MNLSSILDPNLNLNIQENDNANGRRGIAIQENGNANGRRGIAIQENDDANGRRGVTFCFKSVDSP